MVRITKDSIDTVFQLVQHIDTVLGHNSSAELWLFKERDDNFVAQKSNKGVRSRHIHIRHCVCDFTDSMFGHRVI